MDWMTVDPAELGQRLEATGAELYAELRRNAQLRQLLLAWIDGSMMSALRRLNAPLLNERDADMLRGKNAELQKLRDLIINGETR